MSAKEMLEALGYNLYVSNKYYIIYDTYEYSIVIDLQKKSYFKAENVFSHFCDGKLCQLTKDERKVVDMLVKELGW